MHQTTHSYQFYVKLNVFNEIDNLFHLNTHTLPMNKLNLYQMMILFNQYQLNIDIFIFNILCLIEINDLFLYIQYHIYLKQIYRLVCVVM